MSNPQINTFLYDVIIITKVLKQKWYGQQSVFGCPKKSTVGEPDVVIWLVAGYKKFKNI